MHLFTHYLPLIHHLIFKNNFILSYLSVHYVSIKRRLFLMLSLICVEGII